jgi:hypothetical protein
MRIYTLAAQHAPHATLRKQEMLAFTPGELKFPE